MELLKCKCGKTPTFESYNRCHGHGDNMEEIWIECKCGIRTVAKSLYDYKTDREIWIELTRIWCDTMGLEKSIKDILKENLHLDIKERDEYNGGMEDGSMYTKYIEISLNFDGDEISTTSFDCKN